MKSRLNITVEDDLIEQAKQYAARSNTSLSQLVELYFKTLGGRPHYKNAIEIVEKFPKPAFKTDLNLKDAYYELQKSKYGF